MKTLLRLWPLLIAAAIAPAQTLPVTFTAIYEATKSSAAAVTTIQQPSSPTKAAALIGVQLYCSVACTWTLDNGSAASGTTSSVSRTSPSQPEDSTLLFFADSNASAGSTAINRYVLAAGETRLVSFLLPDGRSTAVLARAPNQNFTLRTNSITGDAKATWLWSHL